MAEPVTQTSLLEFEPEAETFYSDVVAGLSATPRTLPCKYFYDERGSQLFEEICELDEYYPTRTELEIISRCAGEMAEQIGAGVSLVEYGSGSSVKTRMLLDELINPVAYVPVDISRDHLQKTADELARLYPHIEMLPVFADFTKEFQLPTPRRKPTHTAVYFPGSTIGNFSCDAATAMLRQIVTLCGCGGGLLIGIDLQKDVDVIEAAYNDARGVTADFNLNLLSRINRELDGNFDLDSFAHRAIYNCDQHRVELSLLCNRPQTVTIGDRQFQFDAGEAIGTEHSHKYTVDGFAELASSAGLTLHRHWTDDDNLFAVLHLVVEDA